MLEILNRYAHGMVLIPLLDAFRERGCLLDFATSPLQPRALERKYTINRGYLEVALRMFESLQWLAPTGDGTYVATAKLAKSQALPPGVMSLYDFQYDRYFEGASSASLAPWIERCVNRWGCDHPSWPDYLDGPLLIPLLLALKTHRCVRVSEHTEEGRRIATLQLSLDPVAETQIRSVFLAKGWAKSAEPGRISLSHAGRFMWERISTTATLAAYRPMLKQCEALLFGRPETVFVPDAAGDETHLDRLQAVRALPAVDGATLGHLVDFIEQYFSLEDPRAELAGIAEVSERIAVHARGPVRLGAGVAADIRSAIARYPFDAQQDPGPAESELTEFVFRWIVTQLRQRGVLDACGKVESPQDIRQKLGLAPRYHRYLDSLLRQLQLQDLISIRDDRIETLPALEAYWLEDPERDLARFTESFPVRHPAFPAAMRFVLRCLRRYGEIITGELDAAEAVFANGGAEVFGAIFQGEPASDYFNQLIAQALASYITRLRAEAAGGSQQTAVRILELGAGAGTASRAILEGVVGRFEAVDFCFSDISQSFLRRARRHFGERFPRVDYRILDISADVATQNFELHSYDVIVAAQVLHDTTNIAQSLRQTLRLLKPGGLLVLYEYTEIKRWQFGGGFLLHGPWLFDDPHARLDQSCLLSVPQWRAALEAAGYQSIGTFCLPTQHVERRCGQAVIVAEGPDVEVASPGVRGAVGGISTRRESAPPRVTAAIPESGTAAIVQHLIHFILGEERVGQFSPARPLMEMGLDSLELVELKGLIAEHLSVTLPPTFLFDHGSQDKIVRALEPMVSEAQIGAGIARLDRSARPHPSAPDPWSYPPDTPAVVGVACRFPGGADSPQAFWEVLQSGRSAIGSRRDRWQWPAFVDLAGAHASIDRAGWLTRIDEFDPAFFRISPKEAELMDPQQRLLLELSWEALEDAGCAPARLAGRNVGVFVGAFQGDYRELLAARCDAPEAYVGTGGAQSIQANRLSYFFDLSGPSEAIDTACSSSLVALHRAVQAIRSGECEMALVGAANLMCTATTTIAYYDAGMLSRSGVCRTFDAQADGYVRGEGGAMLLVKPLHQALADGHSIYGLILGTAVNHGGQANSLTAPKPSSQAAVIEKAIHNAGIDCRTIQYVEAHGTGTPLGDPIEVAGIMEGFRRAGGQKPLEGEVPQRCGIGSVKPTIGHLEAAAGLAGLIKVLLAFRHRRIPGTTHFNRLNPQIELAGSGFHIVSDAEPWESVHDAAGRRIPRRAGVSSFGFGGSNAHVVVDEWDPPENSASGDLNKGNERCIIVFSAKDSRQLSDTLRRFLAQIERLSAASEELSLHDVAYTLQVGREAMRERVAFVVSSWGELETALRDRLATGALQRGPHLADTELHTIATEWARGMDVDWERLHAGTRRTRVHLPTYPFARERYWISQSEQPTAAPAGEARLFGINWRETPIPGRAGDVVLSTPPSRVVLLVGENAALTQRLGARNGVTCYALRGDGSATFDQLYGMAVQALGHLQSVAASRTQQPVLIQLVRLVPATSSVTTGLAGLIKSLAKELPDIRTQTVRVDEPGMSAAEIVLRLEDCARSTDAEIRYVGGKRFAAQWAPLDAAARPASHPWVPGGVYLVTGGAGGLGLLLAHEITERVTGPVIVLVGRSAASADMRSQMEHLTRRGARVEYQRGDVADRAAVAVLLEHVLRQHGRLDGIIHAAGVIRDCSLLRKTAADLDRVMGPKIGGLINLDEATAAVPLDLFVCFSSMFAPLGNAGQSDYATANSMMDHYMGYRNELVRAGKRSGRSVSINWPLWADGGMRVPGPVLDMMSRSWGVKPMPTRAGMNALYQVLASDRSQVLVMFGDERRMERIWEQAPAPASPTRQSAGDTSVLPGQVEERLAKMVCELLKLPPEKLGREQRFNDMGFDSIALVRFANRLNGEFGLDLTPPIFYQHSTVHALAQHLYKQHGATLQQHMPSSQRAPITAHAELDAVPPSMPAGPARVREPQTSGPPGGAPEPIAIIGMSGRFPGAADIEELWSLLMSGRTVIREIPSQRWSWREFHGDPTKEGNQTDVRWGGFIDGVDEFDPLFFNISPREARGMDPQQRLILTYAWKLLEEAGYAASSLAGSNTGVFVGCGSAEYSHLLARAATPIESSSAIGTLASVGPNRVSHFLDLHGPSEPVEAACSSSLVAVCRGMQALHDGDCELALVGGVNTILTPDLHISLAKAGALSKDGLCKTFAAEADGYVRSEGIALLLLKPLAAAERDGDHIHGVLIGGAVNHSGRANSLTAPSPQAQAAVIRKAWTRGHIDPSSISYIEAHGTGTVLGDPIEVEAIKLAFQEAQQADGLDAGAMRCGIGSIKSNIGHLEMAAGVAGIIKVLLQMKHKTLVRSLHCENINPYIRLEDSPLYIVRESLPWESQTARNARTVPLRAGVHSFSITGANAHVILEEYTAAQSVGELDTHPDRVVLILLSARDEARLKEQASQLLVMLESGHLGAAQLADLAYTLQVGRDAMDERLVILTSSLEVLRVKLAAYVTQAPLAADVYQGQVGNSGDTFEILARDPRFRDTVDSWIADGDLTRLAELWVKGMSVDWRKLHGGRTPRRLSLPGHPLRGERYWVSEVTPATRPEPPHEQLLELTSRADGPSRIFGVSLSGNESFFVDHVILGKRTLPAVVYLELVRAVAQRPELQTQRAATPGEHLAVWIEDVTWSYPLFSTEMQGGTVIKTMPHKEAGFEFQISTAAPPEVIYAQGRAGCYTAGEIPSIDVARVRAGCTCASYTSQEIYNAYSAIGVEYGPSHKVLESIAVGQNVLVARLISSAPDTAGSLLPISPGFADGALQATIGFAMAEAGAHSGTVELEVPFEMARVEVFAPCESAEWVVVRKRDDMGQPGGTQCFDLDVCDGPGRSLLRFVGMVKRVLRERKTPVNRRPATSVGAHSEGEKAAEPTSVDLHLIGKPREAALTQLADYLRNKSAAILGMAPADMGFPGRPFAATLLGEFGMDSLAATNLRNVLRRELEIDIPVRLIIADTAGRLADNLYEQILLRHLSSARPEDESVESESFVM